MSRLLLSSDLHLGHKNIHKFRTQFSSAEEHHETVFENLATNVGKRDHLILLGDVAFNTEWLYRIQEINCIKKTLILGNHDTEHCHIQDIANVFDQVHGLWNKHGCWFSHCPMHYQELRGRKVNIHGHLHPNEIMTRWYDREGNFWKEIEDTRYINVCLEHTDYKPVDFQDIKARINDT